jgi:poly-gamma-glutamate capsule biosynthesis protein CapA/YwtB (metallophosphatase superfamily)
MTFKERHDTFVKAVNDLADSTGKDASKSARAIFRKAFAKANGKPLRLLHIVKTYRPLVMKVIVKKGLAGAKSARREAARFLEAKREAVRE